MASFLLPFPGFRTGGERYGQPGHRAGIGSECRRRTIHENIEAEEYTVCGDVQICRSWTSKPIYVITGSQNPRNVYKGLGVDYVIHSNAQDYAFLITDDLISKT